MSEALTVAQPAGVPERFEITAEHQKIIRETICRDATEDEFEAFLHVCRHLKRDPLRKQIYMVKRWDSEKKAMVCAVQMGIDHFRIAAEESRGYRGIKGPEWCGQDGVWKDVWLSQDAPAAARVWVLREGYEPVQGIAHWRSFVQKTKEGNPTRFWANMGPEQLAKCAEAQAHRKAFPAAVGGVYIPEEMIPEEPREVTDENARLQPPSTLEALAERSAASRPEPAPVDPETGEVAGREVLGLYVTCEREVPWTVVAGKPSGAAAPLLAGKTWGEIAADFSLMPLLEQIVAAGIAQQEEHGVAQLQFQYAALALEQIKTRPEPTPKRKRGEKREPDPEATASSLFVPNEPPT